MKTNSKERYRLAWQHHIQELASLALAADIEYNEYAKVRDELEAWLAYAVKHINFKDE